MATIQEQLQIKRSPIDVWDVREKLLLASSVSRNGDQNWMTVSRLMKSYGYPTRPSDWYSQKNCAAQYGLLLEHVETPKRKKRVAGADTIVETPSESIIRRLRGERMLELEKHMFEEKKQYLKLTEEIFNVKTGRANENQLKEMCLEIENEKKRKEKEAKEEAERMRQREEKKLELERQWRPFAKIIPTGQKRKLSETIDVPNESVSETTEVSQPEQKSAMSPLLTSLLKSPTPTSTASLLHSAITSNSQNSSPTIASLLNSSADVTVSAGILQLVSSAISNEPVATPTPQTPQHTNLPKSNIRMLDNMYDSKKDIVQSVISDEEIQLIEEVLKDVEENESKVLSERKEETRIIADESKIGEIKNELNKAASKTITPTQITEPKMLILPENIKEELDVDEEVETKQEEISDSASAQKTNSSLREVSVVLEGLEDSLAGSSDKTKDSETNRILVEEIKVEDIKEEVSNESTETEDYQIMDSKEIDLGDPEQESSNIITSGSETNQEISTQKEGHDTPIEISDSNEIKIETESINEPSPTLNEPDFDDLAISVIKNEKNKRDYSRNKKKELEFLLNNAGEILKYEIVENESDKKVDKNKPNLDADRSESPWTEEEVEQAISKSRRRYSAPVTPSDSVPNSPASSVAGFEDDRDYRAWKKSMMLFYNRLATHKYASLFLKPITDEQAPGYHSVIREPKDLQTLRKNIDNGQVKTTQEFIRYVLLMFQNALMYNKTNEYIYKMAREMQDECIQQILTLVQAQANIETPARRETRLSEPSSKHKTEISSVTKSRKRKLE